MCQFLCACGRNLLLVTLPVLCHTQVASKALVAVPTPGKGTSAEEWVPRGNTAPKGNPTEGVPSEGKEDAGVSGMDVEGEDEQVGGEVGKAEEKPAPPALLAVITHRNGCKLLLRLLAPDHTG